MQATIREMRPVQVPGLGPRQIKILSYNVLAQSLIKRERYPTNGQCVKWGFRSKAFEAELAAYKPEIAVLQEVDAYLKDWWAHVLGRIGMDAWFHSIPGKRHGLLIGWLRSNFQCRNQWCMEYDDIPDLPSQVATGNSAAMVELEDVVGTFLVATTHLYWHPDADYERARQMVCLIKAVQGHKTVILAGDFNSTPDSAAYLIATGKRLTESAIGDLRRSAYTTEFGRDVPQSGGQKPNVVPSKLADADRAISQVLDACTTCFRTAYDPPPAFTTWTDDFKATLDYIFYRCDNGGPTELLDIPSTYEMTSSLPRGGFPSDHVSIMATLVL